jgi:hypothetical protein
LLLLLVGFYTFAFGAARLLLRRSQWEQFGLEAPWLTGPALVVLALSLLAYRVPQEVPTWQAWLVLSAGWVLSAAVVAWERRELLLLVRTHWLRGLTLGVPALVGCGVMLWFFAGNLWCDVPIPKINAYVNYSELAALLTGQHQSEPGTEAPFFLKHRGLRNGQDLIVAAVARLAQRHPLQVILPIAVAFRLQQTIALGL